MKQLLTRKTSRQVRRRKSALRRVLQGGFYVVFGLIAATVVALGLFYARLSMGPVSFGRLPERIAESLATRIGPGWTVALRNTAIELHAGSPALRANGLDIRDPQGALVVSAPYAIVSVDTLSLLSANLQPRAVELRDLQLRVLVNKDGALNFTSELGSETTVPAPGKAEPAEQVMPSVERSAQDVSPVSRVVGSLFSLVVGRSGVLTSLDSAKLTNMRLTIVDSRQQGRAAFKSVDATFSREGAGGHHFEARLDGAQGIWQLSGDTSGNEREGYRAQVIATDAPLQEVLLLSGLSGVPATTDLEFSGRIDAAFAMGRVTELKARLDSNRGFIKIDDKDTSPLQVDRSSIDVAWDENARILNLNALELKGGDTDVRLNGHLNAFSGEKGWQLQLSGRDAVLSGAKESDKPVRLSEISADLSGPDGLILNSVKLRGPDVSADISGTLLSSADPKAIRLDVDATNSAVRSALRIWPEAVAPPVRRFLVSNLNDGLLESIKLYVNMSGADVAKSMSGGPIANDSLHIAFSIAHGKLTAAEGLPPLANIGVTGTVTGRSVTLAAPAGIVDMGGRSLNASEGTFTLANYWDDEANAQIDFRLTGNADGLGALLQSPLVHEIAGLDVDTATMKGKTDLRVGIDLKVNDIPPIAELPIRVNGNVSDLTVEKLYGKEQLENANLSIAYDKGNLSIKGEGKLSGSPASIDVRQGKEGGEASVTLAMDDAARARKGLSFGSQLTGPISVKATIPFGKNPKPGTRIEADLAKAAVDQLIPGWTKPAGRPGKIALTLIEGTGSEVKDLQLDSGSVQVKGSALLTADGALDKADLTTFKLSPGDDMRAQVDLTNNLYKVTIRGNTGDARPFAKSMGGSGATTIRKAGQKDSKDFDLDLSLNILTGYNDEAITNAVIKASVRKESLRQLDVKGRLGRTNLISRTIQQNAGLPIVLVQSDDAGAMLRFLDVYRRMTGGELILQLATGDGPQMGTLTMRDFTLTNEPALRRIIPTQTQIVAGKDSNGKPRTVQVDTNRIDFDKARVDFTRNAGRLDFKDAAIWGSSIGFTLGGYVDYTRDRIDISGTFVPAYGLNNAFAQVPLFGPLLGGSQYEGLFAVNFRVSGQAGSPTLTVNPLSAVAPGFLRKLFGAGEASQSDAPIPETPQR